MLSFCLVLIGATYRLYTVLEHKERTAQPEYVDRGNPHRVLARKDAFKHQLPVNQQQQMDAPTARESLERPFPHSRPSATPPPSIGTLLSADL